MEDVLLEKQAISETRRNVQAYFDTHDVQYVAEDAVFTLMSTGDKYVGREGVRGLLSFFYHTAFDARADIKNTIITEDKALLEMHFVGKHIGEFAGLQPTNRDVDVPMCVAYDLKDGLIQNARVYMPNDVLLKQLTS
jgi:predicted ester cyclase